MSKNLDFFFLFKHVSKLIEQRLDEKTKELGITPQQCRMLFYLSRYQDEGVIQADLEKHFELSKSTVSGLIKRLENKGLIIRKTVKKKRCLYVSEEALAMLESFREYHKELENELLKDFNEEQVNEMRESINHLIEKITKEGK